MKKLTPNRRRVKWPSRDQAERDYTFYSDPSWDDTAVNKSDGVIYTGALLDAFDRIEALTKERDKQREFIRLVKKLMENRDTVSEWVDAWNAVARVVAKFEEHG